jgi:hypothetical protein
MTASPQLRVTSADSVGSSDEYAAQDVEVSPAFGKIEAVIDIAAQYKAALRLDGIDLPLSTGVAVQPVRHRGTDDTFAWPDTISIMSGIETIVRSRRRGLIRIVVAVVFDTADGLPAFGYALARHRGSVDCRFIQRLDAIHGPGLISTGPAAADRCCKAARVGRDRSAESASAPLLLRSS